MSGDKNDGVRQSVLGFLQNKSMNETADYVSRGRAHRGEDSAVLKERWVAAFKRWAADHTDAQALNDLGAELELREDELPYEAVQVELNALTARLSGMAIDDDAKMAIAEDILAYAQAKNKPPN